MKVKMLEFVQGRGIDGVMEPGQEYDVSPDLGAWLLENRKAEFIAMPEPEPIKEPEPVWEPDPAPVVEEAPAVQPRKRKAVK